jgi:hypothetical protein
VPFLVSLLRRGVPPLRGADCRWMSRRSRWRAADRRSLALVGIVTGNDTAETERASGRPGGLLQREAAVTGFRFTSGSVGFAADIPR